VTRKLFSEVCFAIDFVVGVTQQGVEIALLSLGQKHAVTSEVFGFLVIVVLEFAGIAGDYGNVVFMVDLNKVETLWDNWRADIAFTRWNSARPNERIDCLIRPATCFRAGCTDKIDVSGVVDERVVMVLEVVVDALPTRLARCWSLVLGWCLGLGWCSSRCFRNSARCGWWARDKVDCDRCIAWHCVGQFSDSQIL
jgi:hypothetical protein